MFISMGFLTSSLQATSVSLTNPSFELPGTGDQVTVWDNIPGWDSSPTGNGLYKGYNPTDGLWTCYELGSSYPVFQPTGHTIQSGVTYYLTVDAKAQTGTGVQITMYCWKGPEWESKTLITSSDLSVGSTMAEKEISFDSSGHSGQQLIIGFECTGSDSGEMIAVDNVRVTYGVADDTTPPSPDPMTWTLVPSSDSDTAISMVATAATDPSGVEYYFMETSANPGGNDSDWQDSRSYTDTSLDAGTQYCYEIQARDKSVNQNLTAWSTNECATTPGSGSGTTIPITNPSFESGTTGWSGATVGSYEYYAPPDGTDYATRSSTAGYTTQLTGHTIAAGETYTLTLWARTIHSDSYVAALLTSNPYTTGNSATAEAEARFYYGSTTIDSVAQVVNPPVIQGDPQYNTNDDGGNVIVDQGYRMEFAENIFYQLESADPLYDTWSRQIDSDYEHEMAVSPVKTVQGFKALYSHEGSESPVFSRLGFNTFTGTPPDYTWGPKTLILTHTGDENPNCMDAHVYYDTDAGKLWLSWGGRPAYVSELDPTDGYLIGHPSNTEFDTHPAGAHTAVANWNGDEWTDDSEWFEGPCLFKHNGYWYYMVSYGNLGENYTIRGGRGNNPNGPFYDKDGIDMMAWDSSESEYGNSFVLGDDADQVVPGHPHIWEESGTYYLGYDYRHEKGDESPSNPDIFGIRELYWVNDWPTIWTPITLTFDADDHPAAIGQTLGISLRNTGQSGSYAGFDHVSLEYTGGIPDTDPPSPDPMTWASVPTADDHDSISMTATTATDPSGVSYYFDEITGNPGGSDSGWQPGTSYNDDGLNPETQYTYTVTARDNSINHNETAASTAESATTEAQPPAKDYADSDIPVSGTVGGSYLDTQASDDVYEGITEIESGGKPSNRHSYLEHKWTINVTGGTSVTFYVEAYHTSNSEGDDFVFAYSTTGVDGTYTNMVTVTKTVDDDTAQSYGLPASTSGLVHIRVVDTDQSQGNRNLDTIYIDEMYIQSLTGPPDTTPPTPDPMTWASAPSADSSSAISMTATTATDPSGVSYYFDETSGNPGGSDSSWQASPNYTDDDLSPSTQYAYQVKARDNSANQNETGWSTPLAYATTLAGCSPTDCHVEAMVCSEQSCGGPNKNGVATVTIYDDCGDPVVGADVYGTFTGSFNEQVMDTTDGNGVAVLVSTGCLKKPTFQVCVDDVDHTLPYDSNDNLVTCCND